METEKVRYWCYSCEQHFDHNQDASTCNLCQSEAIQLAPDTNDPASYQVYEIDKPPNPQPAPPMNNVPHQHMNPMGNAVNVSVFSQPIFQFGQGFIPWQQPQQQRQNTHVSPTQMGIQNHIHNMVHHMDRVINLGGIQMLLNSLMGDNTLVPAASQEIGKLQKVDIVEECSICQEEGDKDGRKGYRLQCGHAFHIDCLTPWFQRTNTCPSCRKRI